MAKGHQGESCADAIRAVMKPREKVPFSELFHRIRRKGTWTDDTICLHFMAYVVNLSPARRRWKTIEPFLLLHEDGTYELYDPRVHPAVRE